jgi:hypothetical protein
MLCSIELKIYGLLCRVELLSQICLGFHRTRIDFEAGIRQITQTQVYRDMMTLSKTKLDP